jgi:hypothetical protein
MSMTLPLRLALRTNDHGYYVSSFTDEHNHRLSESFGENKQLMAISWEHRSCNEAFYQADGGKSCQLG